ncbi:hypothetical protein B0H14DRAFT_2594944 [Mycena olivaceomarginata]|nr:hypothetical protein B0H14DRAFT_2594944 [Mycena olivaceomarginata]
MAVEKAIRCSGPQGEAEMDRFQEQMEIQFTEFLHCLTAFQCNQRAWIQMSKNSDLGPGFAELAKGTTQMWKQESSTPDKRAEARIFAASRSETFESVLNNMVIEHLVNYWWFKPVEIYGLTPLD